MLDEMQHLSFFFMFLKAGEDTKEDQHYVVAGRDDKL